MNKTLKKEILAFLQQNASKYYLQDLQEEVNKRFNANVTKSVIKHLCYDNEIRWKNKNNINPIGIEPMGKERIVNGDIVVKVGVGKFVSKRRVLYEKYHNVKLTSDDVILFLNKDDTDYSKDNLIKISRREMGPLARIGLSPDDKDINKLAINIAKLKVKIYDKTKEGIIC
jgi:hypothetical protein